MRPNIIVANDEARFRIRKRHLAPSLQEFVKRRVLRVHLGPLNGVDDYIESIARTMRPLRRCLQPIVMISGHQHEFTPPMPGNLDRLSLRLMLIFAELALKF